MWNNGEIQSPEDWEIHRAAHIASMVKYKRNMKFGIQSLCLYVGGHVPTYFNEVIIKNKEPTAEEVDRIRTEMTALLDVINLDNTYVPTYAAQYTAHILDGVQLFLIREFFYHNFELWQIDKPCDMETIKCESIYDDNLTISTFIHGGKRVVQVNSLYEDKLIVNITSSYENDRVVKRAMYLDSEDVTLT